MNERNFVVRLLLPALLIGPVVSLGPAYRTFGRLAGCYCWMNLWVSLPLAIWLSSGWMGLMNHWLVLPGVASMLKNSKLCEADQ